MFNLFKNLFNININKKDPNSETVRNIGLTYCISSELLLDKKNPPKINPITFNKDNYEETLNKIYNTLDYFYDGLWINKIKITNTGTDEIKFEDFYKNEKLSFENLGSIIAVQIDNATKKYINANIEYCNDDIIYINFDTIEPKDSITLNIYSTRELNYLKLVGKTKNFDKPKEYSDYDKIIQKIHKTTSVAVTIITLLSLFCITLGSFGVYFTYKHKDLNIRNPIVITDIKPSKT